MRMFWYEDVDLMMGAAGAVVLLRWEVQERRHHQHKPRSTARIAAADWTATP